MAKNLTEKILQEISSIAKKYLDEMPEEHLLRVKKNAIHIITHGSCDDDNIKTDCCECMFYNPDATISYCMLYKVTDLIPTEFIHTKKKYKKYASILYIYLFGKKSLMEELL